MDFMVYPTFEINERRGILPTIRLPLNYKELIVRFNRDGKRAEIEDYVNKLEPMLKKTLNLDLPIRLQWDNNRGLTHISIGPSGGFYFEERHGWPSFTEHNLGTLTGIVATMITTKYISELLKSE